SVQQHRTGDDHWTRDHARALLGQEARPIDADALQVSIQVNAAPIARGVKPARWLSVDAQNQSRTRLPTRQYSSVILPRFRVVAPSSDREVDRWQPTLIDSR